MNVRFLHPTLPGAALAGVLLAACGAPPSGARGTPETRSADAANVAQQANEPRRGDPTGARPASLLPATNQANNGNPAPAPLPKSATSANTGQPPARISARHVLIQWMGSERAPSSVVRSREQALSVAEDVLRRAKANEDFARLAVEFSDEPGAANRGGSLGRFGRGQMVPAFDAVVFKLEVGQISEIVETPFGFHIIQRTE